MKKLLVGLVLLLASCGKEQQGGQVDGFTWYRLKGASARVEWIQVSSDVLPGKCGMAYQPGLVLYACSYAITNNVCTVYSWLSENEAKRYVLVGTTSVYQHEVGNNSDLSKATLGHCAGYNHVENHLEFVSPI
jgi:hypothetical protein